jgi:hypothetical protein
MSKIGMMQYLMDDPEVVEEVAMIDRLEANLARSQDLVAMGNFYAITVWPNCVAVQGILKYNRELAESLKADPEWETITEDGYIRFRKDWRRITLETEG